MTADLLLVAARAAHLLAAAAWVGGGLVYALVGRPAPNGGARTFAWLVGVCAWALILSGAVLTLDRLADPGTSGWYVALLAAKLTLVVAMLLVASALLPRAVARRPAAGRPGRPTWLSAPYLVLWLGLSVYLTGALMAVTYARGLSAR